MAKCFQDHIEKTQVAVEQPTPQQSCHHHGDDPGDQAEHFNQISEDPPLLIHPESHCQADSNRKEGGCEGNFDGEYQRPGDARILQQLLIIAESNIAAFNQVIHIIQAAIYCINQRDNQKENEDDHGRSYIPHGCKLLA